LADSTLKTQADIFKTLSSTIRLAIVSLLYQQDLAVNEIVDALQLLHIPKTLDRTNVCKNLALLKKISIVTSRKDGQRRVYSLQARCLIDAMKCTLDVIAMKKKLAKTSS
jgi:DNA-binding transcriptional ArsR family regulator